MTVRELTNLRTTSRKTILSFFSIFFLLQGLNDLILLWKEKPSLNELEQTLLVLDYKSQIIHPSIVGLLPQTGIEPTPLHSSLSSK